MTPTPRTSRRLRTGAPAAISAAFAVAAAAAVTAVVVGVVPATPLAAAAHAEPARHAARDLPSDRTPVPYVVRPGDTATGLAVRFHAWTDELVALNHLGPDGALHAGQRIVVPVVGTRSRDDAGHHAGDGGSPGRPSAWQHPDPDREQVRRAVAGAARRHGVDPQLALAVSWQESGWQMGVVSSAHAVGAMQVLPATARWMEGYAGRPLRLHRLADNATAGVLLLRVLGRHTDRQAHLVGAYYQGLGAVRRRGLYGETWDYVRDVRAIERRLEEGRPPA